MHFRCHATWQTICVILTDPVHMPSVMLSLVAALGTCACARVVRARCREIAWLAHDFPKYFCHRGVQYLNTGVNVDTTLIRTKGGQLHEYDLYIDRQMFEARFLALYAPLLSACQLPVVFGYFWHIFIQPPATYELAPAFVVLLITSLCYLLQRAVFDYALGIYFETVENSEDSLDFHEDIMSSEATLEASSGLNYVYLRCLFAIAPLKTRKDVTTRWRSDERRPLLGWRSPSAERGRPRFVLPRPSIPRPMVVDNRC